MYYNVLLRISCLHCGTAAQFTLIVFSRDLYGKAVHGGFLVQIDVQGEDQSDWQEPCEICGRRYFHEHINNKPMYRNAVSDCSSDENN